ncbi:MAG: uroporphyrinogen-III C-methyltransferase [Alphaproteobacteria bacterium]|nr:MAG: uroporphyrinogen-III C-methyltransferase [Alphaproteobacteria bacterium]
MDSLPVFYRTADKTVLLVGSTAAALAKLHLLARTTARIRWVTHGASVTALPHERVERHERAFLPADADGVDLAYVASGDGDSDARIAALLRRAGVPVNVVDRPTLSDFTTPAIVDRTPLLVAISSSGAAPVLARKLRARIETWLPPDIGRLIARAGTFRARLKALLPDAGARRRFWEGLFADDTARDLAHRDEKSFTAHVEKLAHDVAAGGAGGLVQLVGAGPGDPELLTLKAQRALGEADVIIHDRLVNPEILDYARREAHRIHAGKRAGDHGIGQDGIARLMIAHARAGRRVVRLKGGDPMLFGRAGEEIAALREAGIAVEVIPGITAACGAAATAQIPLTHRDHASAVTFVTGHVQAGGDLDWRALAGPDRTLVVYMGVARAGGIAAKLIADGVDPALPVAVIERATHGSERRVHGRLDELVDIIADHAIESPALLVIGAVAALARERPEALSHIAREAGLAPAMAAGGSNP